MNLVVESDQVYKVESKVIIKVPRNKPREIVGTHFARTAPRQVAGVLTFVSFLSD